MNKKILIIDLNYKKNSIFYEEFIRPIIYEIREYDFEVKHYTEDYNPDNYSHIILGGTPLKDFEYLKKLDGFNWILNFKSNILGICAGAQIIGRIFGMDLVENKEIGVLNVEKIQENNLINKDNFKAYFLHRKSLKLNSNFTGLFKTENGICGFKHVEKKIYAVIFHPEVLNEDLIKNFIED